ncbi:MAG: hypothetical protein H0X03_00390 [Nitrosopumilus sp.]|nr:hypothetical protein [Nitrosopumilus sp.]
MSTFKDDIKLFPEKPATTIEIGKVFFGSIDYTYKIEYVFAELKIRENGTTQYSPIYGLNESTYNDDKILGIKTYFSNHIYGHSKKDYLNLENNNIYEGDLTIKFDSDD